MEESKNIEEEYEGINEEGVIITVLGMSDLGKVGKRITIGEALMEQLPKDAKLEAYSREKGEIISPEGDNAFAAAARLAFQMEKDFVFNPNDIWLLISQGFGHYININSDNLKEKIVDFEGKMEIEVERNDFVKGSDANDWETAFPMFGEKVKEYIGEELYTSIVADFSNTTPTQRAASEIVLLYTMKKFFNYVLTTRCGIPRFKIEGTLEDWEKIKSKVQYLRKFGMEEWLECVTEILNKIIDSMQGNVDKDFWNSFYKWKGSMGSGSPTVSGWILNFYPYLFRTYNGQLYINESARITWQTPKQVYDGAFPFGMCSAPFLWKYLGLNFNMKFIAGFAAIQQQGTYLRPCQGWAVMEEGQETPNL